MPNVLKSKIYILLVTCSFTVYANSLMHGFVYDDIDAIVKNQFIKDPENIRHLVDKTYFESKEASYRPVVTFSYIADYSIWRLNPLGYHLTNIILHSINSLLLYVLLKRIGIAVALISTLLFLFHPALTEAVNSISFREDLLVFCFYFTSLIFYLKAQEKRGSNLLFYTISCLSFLFGLLSKEMAVTLPMILILLDLYCGFCMKRPLRYVGYLFVLLFYAYLHYFVFYNPIEQGLVFSQRIQQFPILLGQFSKILFFPINLAVEYPKLISQSWMFVLGLIVLGIGLTMVRNIRENLYSFGLIWILITLIPVYNIIPIANSVAERYLYLAMPGFSLILACLIDQRAKCSKVLTTGFILVMYVSLVIHRNQVWKDESSLWGDAVKKAPTARSYFMLGYAYQNKGHLYNAVRAYKKSLALDPDDHETYVNLGNTYYQLKEFDSAIDSYKKALWLGYNSAYVHYFIGKSYFFKGTIEQAKLEYREALKIDPSYRSAIESLELLPD